MLALYSSATLILLKLNISTVLKVPIQAQFSTCFKTTEQNSSSNNITRVVRYNIENAAFASKVNV